MKFKYILLLLLPVAGFASGGGGGETDIVQRTINFLIFASILYYLINKPLRDFIVGRKNSIADKLDQIQQKLKESKDKKKTALNGIEEAKKNAEHIIQTAEKEIDILVAKIEAENKVEIENLVKNFEEQREIAGRKMVRNVVNEVVESVFKEGAVSIDDKDLLNIVKKKVA